MRRIYLNEGNVDFEFTQTKDDFFVTEIPNREFANKGKYLILKVQKIEMTTWDMVAVFRKHLNIDATEIGYAGLKDKHATTIQYLSFDARYSNSLKKFKHKQIKILEIMKDNKSIRMGDLKANRFGINLYNIDNIKAGQIEKTLKKIEKNGLANYFGYQRFGTKGDSVLQARSMIEGDLHVDDPKLRNFLISVYQSDLFNEWLKKRVNLSSNGKFKLFEGDIYMLEDEKLITPKEIPLKDFLARKLFVTGLLPGRDVFRTRAKAREIEKEFDDEFLPFKGYRRVALIYPQDFSIKFYSKEKKLFLSFTLPKAAYATVLLEALKADR